MSLNNLNSDKVLVQIDKLIEQNFINLANDIGDILVLLDLLFSSDKLKVKNQLNNTEFSLLPVDDCAQGLDDVISNSQLAIKNEIKTRIYNLITILKGNLLKI